MGAGDGYIDVVRTNPASNANGYVVRQVGIPSAEAAGDSVSNPTTVGNLAFGMRWNGSLWQRDGGNATGTAISNATRTVDSAVSADIINLNYRGAHIVLNYSTGQANIVLQYQAQEVITGLYYTLATTATVSATGVAAYILYPGISAGPASFNTVLPRLWRVRAVVSGSLTANFGVSFAQIV